MKFGWSDIFYILSIAALILGPAWRWAVKFKHDMDVQTALLRQLAGTESEPGVLKRVAHLEQRVKLLVTHEEFQLLRVEFDELKKKVCGK